MSMKMSEARELCFERAEELGVERNGNHINNPRPDTGISWWMLGSYGHRDNGYGALVDYERAGRDCDWMAKHDQEVGAIKLANAVVTIGRVAIENNRRTVEWWAHPLTQIARPEEAMQNSKFARDNADKLEQIITYIGNLPERK